MWTLSFCLCSMSCSSLDNQKPIDRWTKGCTFPFPEKGNLGIIKNFRGITLTSLAVMIYNALLLNRIEPGPLRYIYGIIATATIEPTFEKILKKNQNGFQRNRFTTSQILTIRRILEKGSCKKNQEATLLFVDFSKAFNSIHRGKMEEILLTYSLPKETVAAIMMLYKNTKVKVRLPDRDTGFFDIDASVLQGDTLVQYLVYWRSKNVVKYTCLSRIPAA